MNQLLELNCTVQNIRFKADDTGYVILALELVRNKTNV